MLFYYWMHPEQCCRCLKWIDFDVSLFCAHSFTNCLVFLEGKRSCGDGGGDGFFIACEDFGRMFDHLFLACTSFFVVAVFVLFPFLVEFSLH